MKKLLDQLTTQTITQVLFLAILIVLWYTKMTMCTPHFVSQSIKKTWTQRSRFNEINHFYCFIEVI